MVNGIGWDLVPNMSRYFIFSMEKTAKIAQENERAQKKPKQSVAVGDARPYVPGSAAMPPSPGAVVKTVGSPWWSLAPLFRRFRNAAF